MDAERRILDEAIERVFSARLSFHVEATVTLYAVDDVPVARFDEACEACVANVHDALQSVAEDHAELGSWAVSVTGD